jgi:predicted permease
LIIGANLYYEDENSSKFSKKDLITHLIIKCLFLPFFGVIFAYVSNLYIPDHKVLIFASFIQWIMPTSIEIVAIVQSKDINAKQVCLCVAIQWVWLTCLSNFVVLPAFLKAIEAL